MDKDSSEIDKKHKKYFSAYKPNDLFWGIGIENETYLEVPNYAKVRGDFFKNQARERYSVDYYKNYKANYFNCTLNKLIDREQFYNLPYLINSHALSKVDLSGEHATLYTTDSKPNPKFSGKTVFDSMKEKNSYFLHEYEKSFCFDGDTIEFMTQNFYKTNVEETIAELLYHKRTFLKHMNSLKLPGLEKLVFPKENYGFARFSTNSDNLAIFNNGTYHFNFTLPTMLDRQGNIANMKEFDLRHKKAIHILQFFEPFFIAKLGTPDILSTTTSKRFPRGSQRCAASRYISIGTYNTKKMVRGKLLQEERTNLNMQDSHWYNLLYDKIDYVKNEKIGFDINYNKFRNHGIELRFFDWFPEEKLEGVLRFLVHILDHSEKKKHFDNIVGTVEWNSITFKALYEGKDGVLSKEEYLWLKKYLHLKIKLTDYSIGSIYDALEKYFEKLYGTSGPCGTFMLSQNYCC